MTFFGGRVSRWIAHDFLNLKYGPVPPLKDALLMRELAYLRLGEDREVDELANVISCSRAGCT